MIFLHDQVVAICCYLRVIDLLFRYRVKKVVVEYDLILLEVRDHGLVDLQDYQPEIGIKTLYLLLAI